MVRMGRKFSRHRIDEGRVTALNGIFETDMIGQCKQIYLHCCELRTGELKWVVMI